MYEIDVPGHRLGMSLLLFVIVHGFKEVEDAFSEIKFFQIS
jgi:hypothetical protein